MKKYFITLVILLLSLNFVSAEKTILIDKYHDTDNWWGDPQGTGRVLFQELSSIGFKYKISTTPFSDDSLRGVDIVLLWNINNPLENDEITALTKFVEKGGGILILASHEHDIIEATRISVNALLEPFGIRVMKNWVDDTIKSGGCCGTITAQNFVSHPTTESINAIVLYRPGSLEIKRNAIAVVRGSEYNFALGSEPLEGGDVVIAAVSESGAGKVAVVGGHFIFDNGKIRELDNNQFAKNLFRWLGDNFKETVPSQNEPPSQSSPQVNTTPDETFLSWALYLSPFAILLAVYILYLKKKNTGKNI